MKKNFVKYFGVASTTLLAVAPVATPALMTASNLAVVKAGVQDDITAGFKADNSLVNLTADQWKGLTSKVVSYAPDSGESKPATKAYLDELKVAAENARKNAASEVRKTIVEAYAQDGSNQSDVDADGKVAGTAAASAITNPTTATIKPTVIAISRGDGNRYGSVRQLESEPELLDWLTQLSVVVTSAAIYGDDFDSNNGVYTPEQLGSRAYNTIMKHPLQDFISKSDYTAAFTPLDAGADSVFNGKATIFTPLKEEAADDNNGLVTVAPNGGAFPGQQSSNASEDYREDNPDLSYVGDNLVDLQKRTDNELLNLVPSYNQGKNKSGTMFSKAQGQFSVRGGKVIASNRVADGSKVWTTILQAVLNPKDAMYPLFNLTTSNIVKTKMIVNGKDATKNEFITKDEIQNADRISIQFVFRTNDGNEYKSPTIWLTHGNKFTVNTTGLANITRLPGDYYDPAAGITGTINDTGLPMDRKKFVVVPAGTDLAYYTDKNGNVDLSKLAALQGGILGTNGVAVNRGYATAYEGGKLDGNQYWTDPSYFYSKFGSYNDAVDIYYIDGTAKTETVPVASKVTKTKAETKAEAVSAIQTLLKKEIVDNSSVSSTQKIKAGNIYTSVQKELNKYLAATDDPDVKDVSVDLGLVAGSETVTNLLPAASEITKEDFVKSSGYPTGTPVITTTGLDLFSKIINSIDNAKFKEESTQSSTAVSRVSVPSTQLTKIVANAGRTTKVDVPSKYLPQVSFNNYKGATYYGNGATIDNWFNYSWNSTSGSTSGNDPYYPAGGVIVTGGTSAASSSAAKEPISYLAPAAFAANSISADQLQARVTDNIQKFMTAKLSNPNTQTDSKADGYFKAYSAGDAAYAYIKNGAVPGSDLKIDTSKVDVTKPGTYYVEVTYAPLSSIKSNTYDGGMAATNGNVAITDANGNMFSKGSLTNTPFVDFGKDGATAPTTASVDGASSSLTTFAADQIFANGAPATYKLKVQITDGSTSPQSGAPVIAFTEGGQNLKIAKGGTFDQFKGLQFYAYPGAKAWDQKDDSVKVEVSGKVNTNVEGTYTLVYTVTNKAGKTSTLTRVITVGDGVEKPTEYEFNLSQAYIDYVPGYNVREYGYPGDEWTGKQIKHGTSVSVTKRAVFQNGEEWYKLGDGNWVKKQYVKAGQNPNGAVDARGVVTVNYVPGYGIAVYKEPGKSALVQVNGKPKRLAHGTSWKSFKKQIVNNVTYYNVGGNQWVNGNFVNFK